MFDYDNKGMICTDDLLDILTFMIGGNVTRDQVSTMIKQLLLFITFYYVEYKRNSLSITQKGAKSTCLSHPHN